MSSYIGKADLRSTLDRRQMWNCSVVNGSSSCYEFLGMQKGEDNEYRLRKRFLPCPCVNCFHENYDQCSNQHIVGLFQEHTIKKIVEPECPDMLTPPLSDYKRDVLKAFIQLYHDKVPSGVTSKPQLIQCISAHLAVYVNHPAQDAEVAS